MTLNIVFLIIDMYIYVKKFGKEMFSTLYITLFIPQDP